MVEKIQTDSLKVLDAEIDCFGNYDKREIKTCGECGLRKSCSIQTKHLKENSSASYKSILNNDIADAKQKLSKNNDVVELIHKTKKKQKKVEKLMSKIEKKKVKLVVKSDDKKVVKKEKSAEKAGRPRTRPLVDCIGKTMLPTGFEPLLKGLKGLGELNEKKSITTVIGENGVLVSVPIVGRTQDKIELFVNRSAKYKFKDAVNVKTKEEAKSGTNLLVVTNSKKSQAEAIELLTKWKKDQAAHVEKHGGKRGAPVEKKTEKSEKKVVKADKAEKSEKKEGKVVVKKKAEIPAKPEKKGPPVVKAAKPSTKDDEEG